MSGRISPALLLPFEKWHGAGNDFVIADARSGAPWHAIVYPDRAAVRRAARDVCDRHFGVGADGLLLATDDPVTGVAMRMWNPDGTESEMCGNGLRCFGAWLRDRREIGTGTHRVATGAGVLTVEVGQDGQVSVFMGRPKLTGAEIPVIGAKDGPGEITSVLLPGWAGSTVEATCVSMGNPHAVVFTTDVADVPLETFGPQIECHPSFPRRANVEVCVVEDRTAVVVRVWERGAGATLACGTGACAVMVAARLHGLVGPRAEIKMPGGTLVTVWHGGPGDTDHDVLLTGPAVRVFSGTWFGA
jgi:diaminopimelate epimerase